jgi:hypothetical protein
MKMLSCLVLIETNFRFTEKIYDPSKAFLHALSHATTRILCNKCRCTCE